MSSLLVGPGSYHTKTHCGYCNGNESSSLFGFKVREMTLDVYRQLIDRGFRRSGDYVYKPDLKHSCCPQYTIRLDVDQFSITKEHRKVLNRFNRELVGCQLDHNHHHHGKDNAKFDLLEAIHRADDSPVEVRLEPNIFTQEKFDLYRKYQITIHHDDPEDVTPESFKRFLCTNPFKQDGAYHQMYYHNEKLIAIGVVDILPDVVSSVYLIWHPDYANYGLGKISSLREIALAKELGLKYYYMGYYIHSCVKMKYKGLYKPSQLLDPQFTDLSESWHPIERYIERLNIENYVSLATVIHDEDEDSDRLFDRGVPGVLTREQFDMQMDEQEFDIADVPLKVQNELVKLDDLVEWAKDMLRGVLQDLAAAIGVELIKVTILDVV
jgi:arginine-tRNA-protein transferase